MSTPVNPADNQPEAPTPAEAAQPVAQLPSEQPEWKDFLAQAKEDTKRVRALFRFYLDSVIEVLDMSILTEKDISRLRDALTVHDYRRKEYYWDLEALKARRLIQPEKYGDMTEEEYFEFMERAWGPWGNPPGYRMPRAVREAYIKENKRFGWTPRLPYLPPLPPKAPTDTDEQMTMQDEEATDE